MAGEWIKMECSLPDKPETLAITAAMGWDDPDLTVGKLMRLFRWFDQQTIDGNAPSVTPALLDKHIGVTGFVQAVANAGWLIVTDAGLRLENFDRHNGETAKKRALGAKRAAQFRGKNKDLPSSNAASVTTALPREEKRRKETPLSQPDGFDEFWKVYPRKENRPKALAAWKKLGHVNGLLPTILDAVQRQSRTDAWTKEGGQFIPMPASWINGHRWEDQCIAVTAPTPEWAR